MIPSPPLAVCVSIVELALARPLRVRDELTEAVYFRGHSCPNGSRCCGAPDALRRASMPPSVVLREMAAQMVRRASPLSLVSMAEQANRTPPDKTVRCGTGQRLAHHRRETRSHHVDLVAGGISHLVSRISHLISCVLPWHEASHILHLASSFGFPHGSILAFRGKSRA